MLKKTIMILMALIVSSQALASDDQLTANWMATINPNRPINTLMIPGTHDSATYAISFHSKFDMVGDSPVPEWLEKISNVFPGWVVRNIVAQWSKTQPLTIQQQLLDGARYLDLRLCYSDADSSTKHYVGCHALLGANLDDILIQIQRYANSHRKELVIVAINKLYGVANAQDQQALIALLQSYLRDDLVPNTLTVHSTLNDIYATGRNVILLWKPSFDINNPQQQGFVSRWVWPMERMTNQWPQTNDINQLHQKLTAEAAWRPKGGLTHLDVMQMVLTETSGDIMKISGPHGIEGFTAELDRTFPAWVDQYESAYGKNAINIIEQDWFTDQSEIVLRAQQYDSE